MLTLPLLKVSFIMNVVAVMFVSCCIVLILLILVQKGRGGGLSAAFGGGMAGSILGSKTGDFLTWVTIVLVGVFLLLAVVMARFYRPQPVQERGAGAATEQKQPAETEPGTATTEVNTTTVTPTPSTDGTDVAAPAVTEVNSTGDGTSSG